MGKQSAGEATGEGGGFETASSSTEVGVSEEVIWKSRAQDAEEKIEELAGRVSELEGMLSSANEAVKTVERRGEIDRELVSAKAVDLETARLLTEATISQMDAPDVSAAVRELCDRKPFLFACRKHGKSRGEGVAMGPAMIRRGDDELASMASSARVSGDRSELLRYLRVRRG